VSNVAHIQLTREGLGAQQAHQAFTHGQPLPSAT
jgi:hypothetical protein